METMGTPSGTFFFGFVEGGFYFCSNGGHVCFSYLYEIAGDGTSFPLLMYFYTIST